MLDHAFSSTSLAKAIAHCDSSSGRSWRVLEKLGMTREGVLRKQRLNRDGQWVDEFCYGLLREEWNLAPGVSVANGYLPMGTVVFHWEFYEEFYR